MPLKSPSEDTACRRPVWQALSDMFLDTDTSLSRDWRVRELAQSSYSLAELEEILINEVYPVCRWNLLSIAGEWAGFDPEWLEEKIKLLVSTIARLKGEHTRLSEENGRLQRELVACQP